MAGAASGRAPAKGGQRKGNKKRQNKAPKRKSKSSNASRATVASSPVDDNHAPRPTFSNKSLSELLAPQTPMPASCANNEVPANSEHSILFASYSHDDINESDQQPAMNASLINIVSLESDLAATRLIVEEHELEIEKLKSDNSALKSALELLKKTDTNQKAKLEKIDARKWQS